MKHRIVIEFDLSDQDAKDFSTKILELEIKQTLRDHLERFQHSYIEKLDKIYEIKIIEVERYSVG